LGLMSNTSAFRMDEFANSKDSCNAAGQNVWAAGDANTELAADAARANTWQDGGLQPLCPSCMTMMM